MHIFGDKEKNCNEELNDLYSLPSIVRVINSRRVIWAGHVVRVGKRRGVYRVMVGKLDGKRPLGRSKRRWEDNIEMDLQEVECGAVDWIELAPGYGQVAGTCDCGNEPSGSIIGEFLD